MKKDTFKTSIFILLFGGFLVKILGFVIRILSTRALKTEGISYLTIVMPTYSLFITLATFSLPISISKLVSEGKIRGKNIFFSATFFLILFHLVLIFVVFISSSFIATNLLKQPKLTPLIWAMAGTLPFISLSSVLKGYFLGKLKVHPNVISNIFEQLARILFILFFLPKIIEFHLFYGVMSYILFNAFTEFISVCTFIFFLPKHIKIEKKDLRPQKKIISQILQISVPSVSSRFIGNIGFFLEPIILTNFLLFSGYSSNYILTEYAAYNAYAIALLTMPSFFIGAICQVLIPEISKYQAEENYTMLKKRIRQALSYAFLIGLTSSTLIFLFRIPLLKILYKTTMGSDYIFVLAPVFVLFYLEAPLSAILEAGGEAKLSFQITFFGVILKLMMLSILSLCHIGMYSLVFSEIINIIFVVFLSMKGMKRITLMH